MGRRIDAGRHVAWRQRLERFGGWPGTVAEFCRREGVTPATFYQWRKRLTSVRTLVKQDGAKDCPGAGQRAVEGNQGHAPFVELSWAAAAAVEIELPSGAIVRIPADREAAIRVAICAAGQWGSGGHVRAPQEVLP